MGQRTNVQICVKICDFLSLSPPSTSESELSPQMHQMFSFVSAYLCATQFPSVQSHIPHSSPHLPLTGHTCHDRRNGEYMIWPRWTLAIMENELKMPKKPLIFLSKRKPLLWDEGCFFMNVLAMQFVTITKAKQGKLGFALFSNAKTSINFTVLQI